MTIILFKKFHQFLPLGDPTKNVGGMGGLRIVQTIFLGEKGPNWPYSEGKAKKKKKKRVELVIFKLYVFLCPQYIVGFGKENLFKTFSQIWLNPLVDC
jgi:hypothetical protein